MSYSLGLIGLAPMGQNLAQNFANNGVSIAVYNRSPQKTDDLLQKHPQNIGGFYDVKSFIAAIERPRNILLLVKAGDATDATIDQLIPLLEPGDTIVDCGNSFWKDTQKREEYLQSKDINFIGCGISGGWKGALVGPSLMPGGDKQAVENLLPLLEKVAATDFDNKPCTTFVGKSSSGHFVKMVHNGIEYAIMQGIAEIYDILRKKGFSNDEIASCFEYCNTGKNASYLLEITIAILRYTVDDISLIDVITPIAQAKGTGLWTVQSALELGAPCSILQAGLEGRVMSQFKQSKNTHPVTTSQKSDIKDYFEPLFTLYESYTTMAYIQGIELIKIFSNTYNAGVDIQETLRIWEGGCIIRSQLLPYLQANSATLITSKNMNHYAHSMIESLNTIQPKNSPTMVLDAAKNYALSLVTDSLPQNMIQAQRDYFGAHTYTRIDKEGVFTDNWSQ